MLSMNGKKVKAKILEAIVEYKMFEYLINIFED